MIGEEKGLSKFVNRFVFFCKKFLKYLVLANLHIFFMKLLGLQVPCYYITGIYAKYSTFKVYKEIPYFYLVLVCLQHIFSTQIIFFLPYMYICEQVPKECFSNLLNFFFFAFVKTYKMFSVK